MAESEFSASAMEARQSGLPPSPSVENPGRVFPRYSPSSTGQTSFTAPKKILTPEQYVGNPFLMNAALDRLDHAFGEVISILEQEMYSSTATLEDNSGNVLVEKFRDLRSEVERIRLGEESLPERTPSTRPVSANSKEREGGMFVD
ncbi:hypothetical protein D9613_003922 [Agrocybe pediades]|uniref:Uncharacterized protein n=1 Tax=Agrocybe pediades TaxID=84607 RepID=A0A8H4QJA6_9AGAR|nr:hypothetical protein D9613_003922 [Agrocybe pediades]